jgi:hypothetical protein
MAKYFRIPSGTNDPQAVLWDAKTQPCEISYANKRTVLQEKYLWKTLRMFFSTTGRHIVELRWANASLDALNRKKCMY